MGYEWDYPLVMTNTSPWFVDGPNRNRWFTELKHGDVPWQTVSHNQMLFIENHLKLRSRFFSLKIEDPAYFSKCRQSSPHFYIIYPPVNEQFQRAKLPMNVDHFPRHTMFFNIYVSLLLIFTTSNIIIHIVLHHQKSLNIILHIILHIIKNH